MGGRKEGRKARPSCLTFLSFSVITEYIAGCDGGEKEEAAVYQYLTLGNSHQVSREWQEQGRLTRLTKSRNGGGEEVRPVGLVILAAPLMGVIVAHFSLTPQPNPTIDGGYCNSALLTTVLSYRYTQLIIIKTLAIFYRHK